MFKNLYSKTVLPWALTLATSLAYSDPSLLDKLKEKATEIHGNLEQSLETMKEESKDLYDSTQDKIQEESNKRYENSRARIQESSSRYREVIKERIALSDEFVKREYRKIKETPRYAELQDVVSYKVSSETVDAFRKILVEDHRDNKLKPLEEITERMIHSNSGNPYGRAEKSLVMSMAYPTILPNLRMINYEGVWVSPVEASRSTDPKLAIIGKETNDTINAILTSGIYRQDYDFDFGIGLLINSIRQANNQEELSTLNPTSVRSLNSFLIDTPVYKSLDNLQKTILPPKESSLYGIITSRSPGTDNSFWIGERETRETANLSVIYLGALSSLMLATNYAAKKISKQKMSRLPSKVIVPSKTNKKLKRAREKGGTPKKSDTSIPYPDNTPKTIQTAVHDSVDDDFNRERNGKGPNNIQFE